MFLYSARLLGNASLLAVCLMATACGEANGNLPATPDSPPATVTTPSTPVYAAGAGYSTPAIALAPGPFSVPCPTTASPASHPTSGTDAQLHCAP